MQVPNHRADDDDHDCDDGDGDDDKCKLFLLNPFLPEGGHDQIFKFKIYLFVHKCFNIYHHHARPHHFVRKSRGSPVKVNLSLGFGGS